MFVELGRNPGDPSNVDPRGFLAKPFNELEIREITGCPNKELLQWMPTIKDFSGLFLVDSSWYAVKSDSSSIPSWILPNRADILIYSRPADKEDKSGKETLPSPRDYIGCFPNSKNFIVSSSGITQYWFVKDDYKRREIGRKAFSFDYGSLNLERLPDYSKFLALNKAQYKVHSWDELTEQKLQEFLRPYSKR